MPHPWNTFPGTGIQYKQQDYAYGCFPCALRMILVNTGDIAPNIDIETGILQSVATGRGLAPGTDLNTIGPSPVELTDAFQQITGPINDPVHEFIHFTLSGLSDSQVAADAIAEANAQYRFVGVIGAQVTQSNDAGGHAVVMQFKDGANYYFMDPADPTQTCLLTSPVALTPCEAGLKIGNRYGANNLWVICKQ